MQRKTHLPGKASTFTGGGKERPGHSANNKATQGFQTMRRSKNTHPISPDTRDQKITIGENIKLAAWREGRKDRNSKKRAASSGNRQEQKLDADRRTTSAAKRI